MQIRKYKPSDYQIMMKLFRNTILQVNAKDYTEVQLKAWIDNVDEEKLKQSFLEQETYVVIFEDVLVGFGNIDKNGYLDMLYVHEAYQQKGIATLLCDTLENIIFEGSITTHASITARPFFEKREYKVIKKTRSEKK